MKSIKGSGRLLIFSIAVVLSVSIIIALNVKTVSGCSSSKQEFCDGIDNNCNGLVDEYWPDKGDVCTSGTGECERTGFRICDPGNLSGPTVCDAVPGHPTGPDDNCNGIDEDCDGSADDGYIPIATVCGAGACSATGQLMCVSGTVEDTCIPGTPSTEICEGHVDEDCDGQVDEGCYCIEGDTRQCGTTDVGACRYGTQTCSKSQWAECIGSVEPDDDSTCNGIDEDCDGTADNEYVTIATVCGAGACSATGQLMCVSGTVEDTCIPGAPETELCDNGIDDDCDDLTDGDDPECPVDTHFCGDGNCDTDESCSTCIQDCGSCGGSSRSSRGSGSICILLWSCTDWSECYPNGTRSRNCVDENNCMVSTDKPEEIQNCTYIPQTPPCVENWSCTEWGECGPDGLTSRSCEDINVCGTQNEKSAVLILCTYSPRITSSIPTGLVVQERDDTLLFLLLILLAAGLVYGGYRYRKRGKK